MEDLVKYLKNYKGNTVYLVDDNIALKNYCALDLSADNPALENVDVSSADELEAYIDGVLSANQAKVAFGGYLEKRKIYRRSSHFNDPVDEDDERNMHLGVDFWTAAGTPVLAAFDGILHSFQNNTAFGDYGPTIILQHEQNGQNFHTLYGHLSLESLDGKTPGLKVKQGDQVGTLGTAEVNGDYPPHLHFQIIRDMQGKQGDYPGVCSLNDLHFYKKNCPDPNLILDL